ncbi:MAG: hypothetical protein ACOCUH_01355, partial [Bacteriovoracia bacterium]
MLQIITIIMITFWASFNCFAQEEEGSVLVAVGDAELAKEKIIVSEVKMPNSIKGASRGSLEKLPSIVKNDLNFYIKTFEANTESYPDDLKQLS